jgi:hypothetical protein
MFSLPMLEHVHSMYSMISMGSKPFYKNENRNLNTNINIKQMFVAAACLYSFSLFSAELWQCVGPVILLSNPHEQWGENYLQYKMMQK